MVVRVQDNVFFRPLVGDKIFTAYHWLAIKRLASVKPEGISGNVHYIYVYIDLTQIRQAVRDLRFRGGVTRSPKWGRSITGSRKGAKHALKKEKKKGHFKLGQTQMDYIC